MSEEETLAILNDYLTNTFLKHTSTKQAIRWLIREYQKQQKEIEELKSQLDFIDEQNRYIDKLEKEIKKYKRFKELLGEEDVTKIRRKR